MSLRQSGVWCTKSAQPAAELGKRAILTFKCFQINERPMNASNGAWTYCVDQAEVLGTKRERTFIRGGIDRKDGMKRAVASSKAESTMMFLAIVLLFSQVVLSFKGFDQLFCASMLNWVFCLLLGIPCVFCYLGSRTTDGLWALWDFQEGLPVNKKATDIIPSYTLEKQWDNASQTYVATPHEAEQVDGLFPRRLGSLEFFGDWYWNPTRRGARFRSSGFARQAQDASLWPTTQDFSLEVWYRDTVPYSNEFRDKMNIVGFGRSRNSWDCVDFTCVKDLNLGYRPGSFLGAWYSLLDKSISGYDCKTWKNGSSVGWGWGEVQLIVDCKRRCESNFPLCTGFEHRSSRCYFKSRIRRGEEVPAAGSTIYYIKEPEPILWMNTTGDPLLGSCSEVTFPIRT
eukprot:g35457.t1